MTVETYTMIALAVAAWAVSGLISVTYMKAQSAIAITFMKTQLEAIEKHLESTDAKHEQLLRDFNDHRVQAAKDLHERRRVPRS
jgi:hypothetical protein